MNNYSWESKYYEKSVKESHVNIFNSLEIENHIKQILKVYSYNVHQYRLSFSNSALNIFLSIHKIKKPKQNAARSLKRLPHKRNLNNFKTRSTIKEYYLKKKYTNTVSKKLIYLKILKLCKSSISKIKNKKLLIQRVTNSNLSNKLLKNLNEFTNNKFSITLTLQLTNTINSKAETKKNFKNILGFRTFQKKDTYSTEMKRLFMVLATQKEAAKLLSIFIAKQLETTKLQNLFLKFLKETLKALISLKFSKIQGIKILINGRLNNAARSKNRLINIGETPLIKIDSKISYSEATSFTKNGTFGTKIWICEKNNTKKTNLKPKVYEQKEAFSFIKKPKKFIYKRSKKTKLLRASI